MCIGAPLASGLCDLVIGECVMGRGLGEVSGGEGGGGDGVGRMGDWGRVLGEMGWGGCWGRWSGEDGE